jgi:PAS domain S-box-containing protein
MILERKEMVKTLRGENESEYEQVIDHENLLVISIDQNGTIVHFNRECERLSGYKRSEVLNKNIFEFFIPQDYYDKWNDMIASILSHTSLSDFELPFLTRNGHKIMILWSDFPVRNHSGIVGDIGLVGRPVHPSQKKKIDSHLKLTAESSSKKVPLYPSNDTVIFEFGDKKIWFRNPAVEKKTKQPQISHHTAKQNDQKASHEKKNRKQKAPKKTDTSSTTSRLTSKDADSSAAKEKKTKSKKNLEEKSSQNKKVNKHSRCPPLKREISRKDIKQKQVSDRGNPNRDTLETYLGAFDKALHTIEKLERQSQKLENNLEHTLHRLHPVSFSSKEQTNVVSQKDDKASMETVKPQTISRYNPRDFGRIERADKSLVKQYDHLHPPRALQKKKECTAHMQATLNLSKELPVFHEIPTSIPPKTPSPSSQGEQHQPLKEDLPLLNIDHQADLAGELKANTMSKEKKRIRITKANKSLVKYYSPQKNDRKRKDTKKEQETTSDASDLLSKEPKGLNQQAFSAFNKTIRSIQQYTEDKSDDKPKEKDFFKRPIRLKKRTERPTSAIQAIKSNQLPLNKKIKAFFSRSSYFLLDCVGINDKREEFRSMMRELDEHRAELSNIEAQINVDKKDLNLRRKEYCVWRKKLEVLEEEIENRRIDVVTTEKMFNDQFLSSLSEGFQTTSMVATDTDHTGSYEEETSRHHDLINEIQDCAAIIQRGKFKQVNQSLLSLLGYETSELLDKSVINFVESDHFADIKQHYLNRLKGIDAASYQAVFLSKEQNELPLQVNTRPTTFNGEQAELAVFRKLENDVEEASPSEKKS